MANNKFYKYIGAIAVGAAILAAPGCSDDHFDMNAGSENQSPVATKTLWELISENPKLTKFKTIAEKAKYWKDDKHPVDTWTYANVLNSGQIATVWAPEDDSFPDDEYQAWLQMCETNGYNVQQQFLGNHIALWRKNISDSGKDTIKMINGKNLIFDKTDTAHCSIQEIPIAQKNIAAMNGTLHTIQGTTPFRYNFYEYLKFSPSLPILSEYIVSKDTTEFFKDASIEGLPDKDGNPSYVDSVYRTNNILFQYRKYTPASGSETWDIYQECFWARINVEDSSFVMVMPTDEAWTKAKQKLASLYKYPSKYEDKIKGNGNNGTAPVRTIDNPDSLTNMSLNMDLVTPLVFNVNKQPKVGEELWKVEDFANDKGVSAKFLLNTYGDTLRSTDTWNKSSIFNGNMVKMSNGYAFEANEWAFPKELYNPDIEVEINWGPFYATTNTSTYYKVGSDAKTFSFNNNLYADIADKYGHVSRNNFFFLAPPSGTSNPHVEVVLQGSLYSTTPTLPYDGGEVMSGKYDIMVVLVPEWYTRISERGRIDSVFYDQQYIDSIADITKQCFTAQVRYCNNASTGKDVTSKKTSIIEYDGSKVDTVMVWEDFEFPYSYKNMRYSFPTLILEGATKSASQKKGFMYGLYIDRVILRSKETGEETTIVP
ncbi:MAG: hypothetical protein J6W52_11200 [Bacteroidaceae bacterium]|nr:hypothetical protein [Bacteroidaceae bacterium]